VTAALCCLAAALFTWPGAATLRRARAGRIGAPRKAVGLLGAAHPAAGPALAAAVAAALAAAVSTPLVAVLAAGGAASATRAWAARRRSARDDARLLAVTELLAALTAELRSGRPLEGATLAAARAGGDQELGRALVGAVRGAAGVAPALVGPVEEALARLSAAVRLSARTGASLSGVVAAVEDDLRVRYRHRLELRSAVAAPRASAALLAGLPVLGLAMGSGVGADPWHVLTATGPGQVLLVAGVGLEAAGMAWSRRLVARGTRSAPAAGPP
jgi:tight adherence protein B